MTHVHKISLLTLAAALLSACSSTPLTQPDGAAAIAAPTPAATMTPAQAPSSSQQQAAPAQGVAATMLPPHLDPKSAISSERSVYFDYDEFVIKPEYAALVERHGKYLAGKPSLAVRIEGHADERGGAEYNLALGQKRADALMRALQLYGVKPAQMEAISWGEERPKAPGHDEAAWAQNRRDDLQYPKP